MDTIKRSDKRVTAFPSFRARNEVDLPEEKWEVKSLNQSLSMVSLLEKLSAVGLSASYVRRAGLPSWWG